MLAMLAQVAVPTWAAIVGPLLAVGTVIFAAGRVLQRLDDVRDEQKAARAESKSQHEETRREISSLRESRVETAASLEHLRSDVASLQRAHAALVSTVEEKDRAQTTARHDQTNAIATTLRQMVTAEIAAQEAERAARPGRRG